MEDKTIKINAGEIVLRKPKAKQRNEAISKAIDYVDGKQVVNIDLKDCYFDEWSNPISLDGGFIEITVNGFGLSGLADGSDKVPIRFYTIA